MLTNLDFAINLKQNSPSSLEYPELANSERVLLFTSNQNHPSPPEYLPIRLTLIMAMAKNPGVIFGAGGF
jgi:hypothetical protein